MAIGWAAARTCWMLADATANFLKLATLDRIASPDPGYESSIGESLK